MLPTIILRRQIFNETILYSFRSICPRNSSQTLSCNGVSGLNSWGEGEAIDCTSEKKIQFGQNGKHISQTCTASVIGSVIKYILELVLSVWTSFINLMQKEFFYQCICRCIENLIFGRLLTVNYASIKRKGYIWDNQGKGGNRAVINSAGDFWPSVPIWTVVFLP